MMRPVCSSTIMTLLSITTYSMSFSNNAYAFKSWFMLWMRALLTP